VWRAAYAGGVVRQWTFTVGQTFDAVGIVVMASEPPLRNWAREARARNPSRSEQRGGMDTGFAPSGAPHCAMGNDGKERRPHECGDLWSRTSPRACDNLTEIATIPVEIALLPENGMAAIPPCGEPGKPLRGLTDFKSRSILSSSLVDIAVRPEFSTCSFCSGITYSIPTGAS
jgi:hypothetical protein